MIVGKDVALIEQILRVLTYFIRCSELTENTEKCPLLTVDIDDTATLMSTSDTPTPVGSTAADVTLSAGSISTSFKSASPVGGEKLQLNARDSSPAFVLKPAPSSSGRGIHVRFENGDNDTSQCSVSTTESTDRTLQTPTVSDCSASTTPVAVEQYMQLRTENPSASGPHLFFRSDVSDTLPPLLGLTCSGCDYMNPCEDCSKNLKCSNLTAVSRKDDNISCVGSCKSSHCSTSDTPSSERNCEESLPCADSPKPCQLSPVEANENVRVERIVHVGREPIDELRSPLHRVPLEKPTLSTPDSCHNSTSSPVLASKEHIPARHVPQYQRGTSMFDEYFDGISVIDLCSAADGKSTFTFGVDDTSTFDEIMNEPCPDVSHIDVNQLSSGSSSSEMVPDPLADNNVPPFENTAQLSSSVLEMVTSPITTGPIPSPDTFDNVFYERHFAVAAKSDEHLDDIPDGPSKQMISSAIRLMQYLCLDHTSQSSVDDLADVPASDYFSQTGLGPSRGRQRQPSGQSNASARCR